MPRSRSRRQKSLKLVADRYARIEAIHEVFNGALTVILEAVIATSRLSSNEKIAIVRRLTETSYVEAPTVAAGELREIAINCTPTVASFLTRAADQYAMLSNALLNVRAEA